MKIIIIDSGFSICGRNIEHLNTLDGIAIEKKMGNTYLMIILKIVLAMERLLLIFCSNI